MAGRTGKNITPEQMRKVWVLYGEQVSEPTISGVCEISRNSVSRIINIMSLAKEKKMIELAEYYNGNYIAMKEYACEYFKIPLDELHAAKEKQEQMTIDDQEVMNPPKADDRIDEILRLVRKICAELGIE